MDVFVPTKACTLVDSVELCQCALNKCPVMGKREVTLRQCSGCTNMSGVCNHCGKRAQPIVVWAQMITQTWYYDITAELIHRAYVSDNDYRTCLRFVTSNVLDRLVEFEREAQFAIMGDGVRKRGARLSIAPANMAVGRRKLPSGVLSPEGKPVFIKPVFCKKSASLIRKHVLSRQMKRIKRAASGFV